MGIRQTLNEKKGLAAAVAGGVVVIAIALMAYNLSGPGAPSASEAYYTTDDGQSYFGGSVKDVPPFQKDGKTAVRAHVYRCTKCGKTFVNHLERYTPDVKKKVEAAYARGPAAANDPTFMMGLETGIEVKPPGTGAWVKATDPKYAQVVQPKCPGGGEVGEIERLVP